jgi:hypothetical protein
MRLVGAAGLRSPRVKVRRRAAGEGGGAVEGEDGLEAQGGGERRETEKEGLGRGS